MPRPVLLFVLFVSACCRLGCSDCPVPPACEDASSAVNDGAVDVPIDVLIVEPDAAVAGVDAIPRPVEPVLEQCVGHRGNGEIACLDQDQYERGGRTNGTMVRATMGKDQCGQLEKEANIGDLDVDVFRTGTCKGAAVSVEPLRPWVELTNDYDVSNLRVCIFPTCNEGSTNVFACFETAEGVDITDSTPRVDSDLYNNEVGFRGCCRIGPGRITAKAECPRGSTSIDTYLWVDSVPTAPITSACQFYRLRHKMM